MPPKLHKLQLFDLASDPDERRALVDRPAGRETLERLSRRLAETRRELGDPLAR